MKLFTCTDHDGHYPVGTASIVIAKTKAKARKLLSADLRERGLAGAEDFTLHEVDLTRKQVMVLRDGNY